MQYYLFISGIKWSLNNIDENHNVYRDIFWRNISFDIIFLSRQACFPFWLLDPSRLFTLIFNSKPSQAAWETCVSFLFASRPSSSRGVIMSWAVAGGKETKTVLHAGLVRRRVSRWRGSLCRHGCRWRLRGCHLCAQSHVSAMPPPPPPLCVFSPPPPPAATPDESCVGGGWRWRAGSPQSTAERWLVFTGAGGGRWRRGSPGGLLSPRWRMCSEKERVCVCDCVRVEEVLFLDF